MNEAINQERYDIEKQIYETQWTNIRHHWTQTFAGSTFLSTLIALAIVPIQLLRSEATGTTAGQVFDPYIKWFVAVIIFLLGIVTFLNQYNHYM